MPRLIHLNGPPGIGKSTLAQLYVDNHPLVLNLDIDRIRGLLGGWRERFAKAGELARPLALGMAATHLRSGHDVVMPQFLGRVSEVERFAKVADDSGAEFVELVVMDSRARSTERFYGRGSADDDPWHDDVKDLVERVGGPDALADMYDRLLDTVHQRPGSRLVNSREGEVESTYATLCEALEEMPG